MADIFLSYSRQDLAAAERVAKRLEAAGFSVWWDQSLVAGESWNETLSTELKAAKAIVVLWSKVSWASRWVQAEAHDGYQRRVLVAARLDDVEVGPPFNIVHMADLSAADGHERLAEGVKRLLNAGAPAPAPTAAALPPSPPAAFLPKISRRYIALWAAALFLVVATGAWFLWGSSRHAAPSEHLTVFVGPPAPPPVVATASSNSIAVLPFENLSSDKDNAYFAAGIQDEILTRLSKIGALKVISRTSTSHFASQPDNLPEIARQLGVANILEGSVQKVGDTVRVNVQLIKAGTDGHLWAEIYDRKLVDIFSVQTEIATAIAQALNATISGSESQAIAFKPTENLDAYDAYLRALRNYRDGASVADFSNMEKLLKQAVALDPNFALAWARLSEVDGNLYFVADTSEARRAETKSALETALRLQPDLLEVQLAQANYKRRMDKDFDGARRQLEELLPKWPNNSEIVFSLAVTAKRQGRWNDSMAYSKQAIRLDPFYAGARDQLVVVQDFIRDYTGTLRTLDEGLAAIPQSLILLWHKAYLLQRLGRLDEAELIVADFRAHPSRSTFDGVVAQAELTRTGATVIAPLKALIETGSASGASALEIFSLRRQLGWLLLRANREAEAREQFVLVRDSLRPAAEKQPDSTEVARELAWAYAGLGDRDNALKFIERVVHLLPSASEPFFGIAPEASRARIWAYFGDGERAIPELARLLKAPGNLTPATLRLDPDFDKLRGDPRFEALTK